MKDKKKKANCTYQSLALLTSLASTMVANLLVGTAIGIFLDKYFQTKPWFTLIFIFLGAAAGFKSIYTLMQSTNK